MATQNQGLVQNQPPRRANRPLLRPASHSGGKTSLPVWAPFHMRRIGRLPAVPRSSSRTSPTRALGR